MYFLIFHSYKNFFNSIINILVFSNNFNELRLLNFSGFLLINIIFLIVVILCTAYVTLLERKELASFHHRKGPNKIGFLGLLQPFSDAFKLVFKETVFPRNSVFFIFFIAPFIAVIFGFVNWVVLPLNYGAVLSDNNLSVLFVFVFSIVHVYSIILAGWSSNSRYSFIGAIRSSAQLIAYDITLGVVFLNVLLFTRTLNITKIVLIQNNIGSLLYYCFFLFILFMICALAETNRHPFDLPEAESELVSGYNVEYSAVNFALFFLGEYSSMVFMSIFAVNLFWGGWVGFFYFLKIFLILSIFLMAKAGLPRYRYDQLMAVGWKIILPIALFFFILNFIVLYISFNFLLSFSFFFKHIV